MLKTYIKYGERCPERLNGIFAFAVFNTKSRTLFLCRDKIGVKPLFYHEYDGGLLFGSEIKALLASGVVKPQSSTNRGSTRSSFWGLRERPPAAYSRACSN